MIKNYNTYINESIITKDKKKELFNYSGLINSAWNPLIQDARKFQNISFDLENNDSTKQKKTIYIKRDLRVNQPIKYEFNCELFKAGGDWEWPVMYFRIEFTHVYGIKHNKWKKDPKYIWDIEKNSVVLYNSYVIIPPIDAGNSLQISEDGKLKAYVDSEMTKEDEKIAKITPEDEKKAWKWLEQLMEELVEERHEQIDKEDSCDVNTLNESETNGMVLYHGSTEYFTEFKYIKGTLLDTKYISPIFLSTDKNFALYYSTESNSSYLYTIKLLTNNIFDYRKIATAYDIVEYKDNGDNGIKEDGIDYDLSIKLYDYVCDNWEDDNLEKYASYDDELYNGIVNGDYSYIEQVWFYEWLKDNNYDGAYVSETETLNIFIFNTKYLEIINIKNNNK